MKYSEKELEKILKALANRRRILILKFIREKGSVSVGEVARYLKLSFKSTSKHLQILANAGMVEKEQVSLVMLYSLAKDTHPITKKVLGLV